MGKTSAPELPFRPDIPAGEFEKILTFMAPYYRTILEILYLSGARPSEICQLRPADLSPIEGENGKPLWVFEPQSHKTKARGKKRRIFFSTRIMDLLQPILATKSPFQFVFCPADALLAAQEDARTKRKYPMTPSQLKREKRQAEGLRNRLANCKPQLAPALIGSALQRAYQKATVAGVPCVRWTPYQIRHTAGTEVTIRYGEQAAQHFLGHSTPNRLRNHYDHSADHFALEVAEERC